MTHVARTFPQQSRLERTLRAQLWPAQYRLCRAQADLPKHVKAKEYARAAECQAVIIRAEREVKLWVHLIKLYSAEFDHRFPPCPLRQNGSEVLIWNTKTH